MVEVVISVPDQIKYEFPHVGWSKIAERAIVEEFRKLASIKLFNELFKHSELTDRECIALGKDVNRAVRSRIERDLSISPVK
ncbi:hypothetical protein BEH94_04955 [Candidatus Altiarchaeales archaeon WOR_SM1_SCG]|nr:hypothetical protein BEH94_04955 [Candidatus Altiarchaeales archaeon WOR_SM1_SCG]